MASESTYAIARPRTAGGIYFGWRVVAALFLSATALMGVAIYGFIIFSKALAEQFGWSAAQTGTLVSAMWMVAPLALFAAPIIERVGPWRIIMFGLSVQVAALLVLPHIAAFWQLYLLRLFMGVGKILIMTSLPLVVARWFDKRFATAVAVAWAGGSFGGFVFAPLAEHLMSTLGWKTASVTLAGIVAVIAVVAGALARGAARPADLGLACDGDAAPKPGEAKAANAAPPPEKLCWKDVLGSINWLTVASMAIASVGVGMASIATQSQEPALLEGAGLSSSVAATLLGVTAGACLIGSLMLGWLLDRFNVVWSSLSVAAAMYLGLLSFSLLSHSPSIALGALGALGVGYAFGGGEVLWIALFKRQFGAAAFTVTYGIFYFSLQVGYATGGFVGGWSLEHLHLPGLLIAASLMFLAPALFSLWRPGGRNLATAR